MKRRLFVIISLLLIGIFFFFIFYKEVPNEDVSIEDTSPNIVNNLEKVEKDIENYVHTTYLAKNWEYFVNESNEDFTYYILWLWLGMTEFILDKYRIIFYNDPEETYWENNKNYIQIFDTNNNKLAQLDGTHFGNDGWHSPKLTSYKNGYLKFSSGWEYFYNYRTKDFIDMYQFMDDNFEDYGGNLFIKLISDDTLSIQAFLGLHQEEWTNYYFELDLNNMKIKNVKKDVEELLYEDYFFKEL